MRGLAAIAAMAAMVVVYLIFANTITSPELTSRYNARQQAQLQAEQARQQAEMVRAQQQAKTSQRWAQTWEVWGVWGTGGMAAAVIAGVGGYAVVQWQRDRTKRHVATEYYSTQRHLISAHRDIAIAYIATSGDPDAYRGKLGNIEGVFLPAAGEFVPLDVCRAELAQTQRMITMEVG